MKIAIGLITVMLALFLIPIASSQTIPKSTIKVLENSDQCLTDCYAILELTYNNPETKPLGDVLRTEFFSDHEILIDYDYNIKDVVDIPVPVYRSENCKTKEVNYYGEIINQSTCSKVLDHYSVEQREQFVGYDRDRPVKQGDKIILKLSAKKKASETIKWDLYFDDAYLDPWWNESWNKKAPIEINSSVNLTNYQIRINLSYDSDMNNNFTDIAFVNGADDTELPFDMREESDGEWAVFVVKANLTINNGTQMYVYYDNDAQVTSREDPNSTYYIYDDFSGALFDSKWNETWTLTQTNGVLTESGGILNMTVTTQANVLFITSKGHVVGDGAGTDHFVIEFNSSSSGVAQYCGAGGSSGILTGNGTIFNYKDATHVYNVIRVGGSDTLYPDYAVASSTAWINRTIVNTNGGGNAVQFYWGGNATNTTGLNAPFDTWNATFGFPYDSNPASGYVLLDYVRVYQYTASPPSYAVGSEEETTTNISVSLEDPADANITGLSNNRFRFTAISGGSAIENCSVYTNETGSWILEESNSSEITNYTSTYIDHLILNEGTFIWNVECCVASTCAFNDTNRSITTDFGDITDLTYENDTLYYDNWTVNYTTSVPKNISRIVMVGSNSTEWLIDSTADTSFWYLYYNALPPDNYTFNITSGNGYYSDANNNCIADGNCTELISSTGHATEVGWELPFTVSVRSKSGEYQTCTEAQCPDLCYQAGQTVSIRAVVTRSDSPDVSENITLINPSGSNTTNSTYINTTHAYAWSDTWVWTYTASTNITEQGNHTIQIDLYDSCGSQCEEWNSTVFYVQIDSASCGPFANAGDTLSTAFGIDIESANLLIAILVSLMIGIAVMVLTGEPLVGGLGFLGLMFFFFVAGFVPLWIVILLTVIGGFAMIKMIGMGG